MRNRTVTLSIISADKGEATVRKLIDLDDPQAILSLFEDVQIALGEEDDEVARIMSPFPPQDIPRCNATSSATPTRD